MAHRPRTAPTFGLSRDLILPLFLGHPFKRHGMARTAQGFDSPESNGAGFDCSRHRCSQRRAPCSREQYWLPDFLQQLVQRFLGMKGKRRRFGCFNHGQFLLTPTPLRARPADLHVGRRSQARSDAARRPCSPPICMGGEGTAG